jgi:hypothetical protein
MHNYYTSLQTKKCSITSPASFFVAAVVALLSFWSCSDSHSDVQVQFDKTEEGIKVTGVAYELQLTDERIELTLPEQREAVTLTFAEGNLTNQQYSKDKVIYEEVYPNTDLQWMDNQEGNIRYDVILHPGADVEKIAMDLSEHEQAYINDRGELAIPVEGGEIRHSKPYAYQEIDGEEVVVESAFFLQDHQLGFEVGAYDETYTLVIDPDIYFSESSSMFNGRVASGLQALYTFQEGSGGIINDVSNIGTPLDVTMENNNYHWEMERIDFNSPTRASNAANNSKIYTAVTASNELTVEAWVRPADNTQNGPARIVTMSTDWSSRNFTIGQEGGHFIGRIRTTTNGVNGDGIQQLTGGTVQANTLTHIVMTFSGGVAKLYVNGVLEDTDNIGGNFSNWDANMDFGFGNEFGFAADNTERDWQGDLDLVAIYSRELSLSEVSDNLSAGANENSDNFCDGTFLQGTQRLFASSSPTSETLNQSVPDGTYRVRVKTMDEYVGRENATQLNEQIRIRFFNGNTLVTETGYTNDLPDQVRSADMLTDLGIYNLANVDKVVIEHFGVANSTDGSPNSVQDIEICLTAQSGTIGTTACVGNNGLTYQRFDNISGGDLHDLINASSFPDSPSSTSTLPNSDTPNNIDDNYGTRIRGFIVPSTTGTHQFNVTSDDDSQVWLSTDDQPENAAIIAAVDGFTNTTEYTKYHSQTSATYELIAGQRYYVEILHKEGTGGDHVQLWWKTPTVTNWSIITSSNLRQWACGNEYVLGQFCDGTLIEATQKLYSNRNPMSETINQTIANGSYRLRVKTFDEYAGRTNITQLNEQVRIRFFNGNTLVAQTGYTTDIPDRVERGEIITDLGTYTLANVDKVVIEHIGLNESTDNTPNSVEGIELCLSTVIENDYGDAPSSYGDICYVVGTNGSQFAPTRLGNTIDAEPAPIPGINADGDDLDGIDDEDGVTFSANGTWQRGSSQDITVSWSTNDNTSHIYGWIDFNGNGTFDDPSERVIDNYTVGALNTNDGGSTGTNTFTIAVPTDASCGITYARFTINSDVDEGGPTGLFCATGSSSDDGEVEDYQLTIDGLEVSLAEQAICAGEEVILDPVVSNAVGDCVFQATGGTVVMEAEDFASLMSQGDTNNWEVRSDDVDAVGGSYVTTANDGVASPNFENGSKLTYKVALNTAANYTIYVRRKTDGGSSNSAYGGFNGIATGVFDNQSNDDNQWVWRSLGSANLTAGQHDVEIVRREDGYRIDRIVVTNGSAPSDDGPLESNCNLLPGSLNYVWSTGATTETITVSPTAETPYSVTVTDASGCEGVATTTVTINDPSECIPTCPTNDAPLVTITCQSDPVTNYTVSDYTRSCSNNSPQVAAFWTSQAFSDITPSGGSCSFNAAERWNTVGNAIMEEYDNETALVQLTIAQNCDPNKQMEVTLVLSGRTFSAPANSPEFGASTNCVDNNTPTDDWYYYTEVNGYAEGKTGLEGLLIQLERTGPALQIGTGANQFNENGIGLSSWLKPTIVTQPDNGPAVKNTSKYDINVDLDGNLLEREPNGCLELCTNESITLTANVPFGTAPFSYLWNDNSTNATLIVSTPGTYTVSITDQSSCTTVAEVMVTEAEDCDGCEEAFGALKNYSVIAFGDLNAVTEIEGSAIVGGNLNSSDAFQVATELDANNFGSDLSRKVLEVAGDVVAGNAINIANYSAAFTSPVTYTSGTQGSVQNANNGQRTVNIQDGNNAASSLMQLNTIAAKVADLEEDIQFATQQLCSLPSTPNATLNTSTQNATLTITSTNFAVLTLSATTANDFFNSSTSFSISTPDNSTYAAPIIINIQGTDYSSIPASFSMSAISADLLDNVIWNFCEATVVDIPTDVRGSLLAPFGDVTLGGSIDGVLAAQDISIGAASNLPFLSTDFSELCDVTNQLAVIGNYIWVDEDSNGLQDEGEVGIPNVKVILKNGSGVTIATTFTDANGQYLFSNLLPGDYFVDVDETTLPNNDLEQTPFFTNVVDGNDGDTVADDGDFGNKDHSGTGYPITLDGGEENLTADFGYNYNPDTDVNDPTNTPLAAVGDFVWIDDDGDGVQDPNEPGVPGVKLTLSTNYEVINARIDINRDGAVNGSDDGVVIGSDGMMYDVINGYIDLDEDGSTNNDAGDASSSNGGVTIGGFTVIDGRLDINGDNIDNSNDDGRLDEVGIDMTMTDEGGYYLFDNLEPGLYFVEVVDDNQSPYSVLNPNLYDQTGDPDHFAESEADNPDNSVEDDNKTTKPVLLTPGDVFLNVDFGYQPEAGNSQVAAIGDYVWFDADRDGSGPSLEGSEGGGAITQGNSGTADPDEYGIEGVSVALIKDENANSIWEDGEPIIATDVTDENGLYYFPGLVATNGVGTDDYIVWVNDTENVLQGLKPTRDKDGGMIVVSQGAPIGQNANNVLGLSSQDLGTGAAPNADRLNHDFGYAPMGQEADEGLIGDYVWFDTNQDGVQDPEESGIEGVIVELLDDTGNVIFTTTTNENGYYYFGNLSLDEDYQVVISDDNFDPNGVLSGLENTFDPDGNTDNEGILITLTSSEPTNLDQDFGYSGDENTVLGSIGNKVWEDTNADGIRDDGEVPIEGLTIDLYRDLNGDGIVNPNEPFLGTQTTDENGMYLFDNLPLGDYIVDVTDVNGILNGYWQSLSPNQDVTTSNGNDVADNSKIDGVQVTIGNGFPNDNLNVDFSFYKDPAAIGNFVWNDLDNDGIQDANEPGIEGVEVDLMITFPDGTELSISTLTDANGFYEFPNLLLDEDYNGLGDDEPIFVVSITTAAQDGTNEPLNNLVPTLTDVGTNDLIDSDEIDGVTAFPIQGNSDTTPNPDPSQEEPIASYDFGFSASDLVGIGGTVFDDRGEGSGTLNDGSQTGGEPGIEGVLVQLFDDQNNFITSELTNADGNYLFTGLPEGKYKIVLPASNFSANEPLNNLPFSSVPTSTDDDDQDNDDNGIQTSAQGMIMSPIIMLTAGTEPSGTEEFLFPLQDGSNNSKQDVNTNTTIDFGVQDFVLPVELIGIKAVADNDHIDVLWATASELDNSHFEVERSEDAKSFKYIGRVDGQGTTLERTDYRFEDKEVAADIIYYYRLKQVDIDGAYEYTDVVSARLDGKEKEEMVLYPNPIGRASVLNVRFFASDLQTELYLLHMNGAIVKTIRQEVLTIGWTDIQLSVSDLAAGTYFVADSTGHVKEFIKVD